MKTPILVNQKRNSGITLIALVITIVILLILATISIVMLTGENGILTKATRAKKQAIIGEEKEQITLAYNTIKTRKIEEGNNDLIIAADMNTELEAQNIEATAEGEKPIIVKFKKTGNIYTVDSNREEKIQGPINEEGGTEEKNAGEIPEGYIKPEGTMQITKNGEYDVRSYEKANVEVETNAKYTEEEYQAYGTKKYKEGIDANANTVANAVGYKSGRFTPDSMGKKYIECGFKPKIVLIGVTTEGDVNAMIHAYKEEVSQTKSFSIYLEEQQQSVATFTMEGDGNIVSSSLHIYKVDNTGFGFYFSKLGRTINWTAFK